MAKEDEGGREDLFISEAPSAIDLLAINPAIFPFGAFEFSNPNDPSGSHIITVKSPWKLEVSSESLTETPTIPTPYAGAHLRNITVWWTRQDNLKNFARYEVQVSEDDATWYSLRFDGVDWKDTLDAVTAVYAPAVTHTKVPLKGTEAYPLDRTLYYRVRQVTRASVYSDWSSSVSASASPLDTGGMAYAAVSADKIVAGAIAAREMSFSDDIYNTYDELPSSGCEYWDLMQPDCKSHLGHGPDEKNIVYFPGHLYDEIKTEYDNAWVKFTGRGAVGVFKSTENEITGNPEDLTSGWSTFSTATATLSDYSFAGSKFTEIDTGGTANSGVVLATTIPAWGSSATRILRVIVKKGTASASRVGLYEAGAGFKARFTLTWSTKTITVNDGSLVYKNWYGDEIVEIALSCTAGGTGNDHDVYCYGGDRTVTGSTYYTQVSVESSDYPTPYTPTSRDTGALVYPFSWGQQGTIEVWVRPWFTYDIGNNKYIISDFASNVYLYLRYDATTDKWRFSVSDGTTTISLYSLQITSNADLWKWWHLKITWDTASDEYKLYVNGSLADSSTTALSTITFNDNISIGSIPKHTSPTNYVFNGLITDLLYKNSVDTSTDHYDNDVPYYDPDEVVNKYQSVRINKTGIRMHDASLTITDDYNRLVDISNESGLLAKDAGGTIIHDIPDAPVLTDMVYGGHILWDTSPDYITEILLSYTDTSTYRSAVSSTYNTDVSSYLPGGLDNAKGMVGYIELGVNIATAKRQSSTYAEVRAKYSLQYNVAPSSHQNLAFVFSPRTSSASLYHLWIGSQCFIPIVYDNGVPYITWSIAAIWYNLTSSNDNYAARAYLYYQGVLV